MSQPVKDLINLLSNSTTLLGEVLEVRGNTLLIATSNGLKITPLVRGVGAGDSVVINNGVAKLSSTKIVPIHYL